MLRSDRSDAPPPPRRRLAVVACMDSRLTVEDVLGLSTGDAHIIRNAGGLATDDAIRSLVISQNLLGTEEVIVIEHTGCGMLTFRDEDVRADLAAKTGADIDLPLLPFPDLEGNLREQVERIRRTRGSRPSRARHDLRSRDRTAPRGRIVTARRSRRCRGQGEPQGQLPGPAADPPPQPPGGTGPLEAAAAADREPDPPVPEDPRARFHQWRIDDDPSGIGTYATAGASLGYATLWTALLTFPLMSSVQYICAKIGLVTGRGLAGVLRRNYPRPLLYRRSRRPRRREHHQCRRGPWRDRCGDQPARPGRPDHPADPADRRWRSSPSRSGAPTG